MGDLQLIKLEKKKEKEKEKKTHPRRKWGKSG